MPYITVNRSQRTYQLTFDDIINGIDPHLFEPSKDTRDTTTYFTPSVSDRIARRVDYWEMHQAISSFVAKYKDLIETENKSTLYYSFKIPKRSGGLRPIDAPNEPLMIALTELKSILEKHFLFTYHTCAFAYVRGRSTIDAVKRHQKNGSRWVLKTDLSKFFPNTTPDFLMKMLYMTFPLCEYIHAGVGFKDDFEKIQETFIEYNDYYFKSVFFDLAPLLSIPLYQQHKARE